MSNFRDMWWFEATFSGQKNIDNMLSLPIESHLASQKTRWLIGIYMKINLIVRLSKSVKQVHQDAPSLLPEIPNMKLINGEQFHHGISCLAESFRHWHPCATQLCPCKRIARLWDARPTEDDVCSPLTSSIFLGVGNDLRLVILGDKIPWTPGTRDTTKTPSHVACICIKPCRSSFAATSGVFCYFLGGNRGLGLTKMDEKKIRILSPGLFVVLFLGEPKWMRKNEENIWSLSFFTVLLFFRDGYKLASKYCMRQQFLGTFLFDVSCMPNVIFHQLFAKPFWLSRTYTHWFICFSCPKR